MKEELIDFLKWYKKREDLSKDLGDEFYVDVYLKLINSSPCERKADSNNEAQKKDCYTCKHESIKYSDTCADCDDHYSNYEQSA